MHQKKALIIGLGISGRGAAQLLLSQNHEVWAVDKNHAQLSNLAVVQDLEKKGLKLMPEIWLNLKTFDLIITSPGVPPEHFLIQEALTQKIEILGEIELAVQYIRNPLIGISGTNGKTTVTLMLTHVLNHTGRLAKALGNIGAAASAECSFSSPRQLGIMELSSYQLESLKTPVLKAGLILNITPDHLDRYSDVYSYALAKARIEKVLKEDGILYLHEEVVQQFPSLFQKKAFLYGYSPHLLLYTDYYSVFYKNKKVFNLPYNLQGRKSPDLDNFLATCSLCLQEAIEPKAFLNAYSSFKKPPHRMQFIKNVKGVSYYDDSKGTNVDAVTKAVESFTNPLILIVGGVDKGASYLPWIKAFQGKVKKVYAIGKAADKIASELSSHISIQIVASIEEAVREAAHIAQKGDNVLLSPGCASYDMFKNYEERGKAFQAAVNILMD